MTDHAAIKLMLRRLLIEQAASFFGCSVRLFLPLAKGGTVTLEEAFGAVRRDAEFHLRAIRFARRSAYMKARRGLEREAKRLVERAFATGAREALRGAVVAILDVLAVILSPIDPSLSARTRRAAQAIKCIPHKRVSRRNVAGEK